MGNSYLVLGGAGMMGTELVYDLLNAKKTSRLVLVDSSMQALSELEQRISDPRLFALQADVTDKQFMKGIVEGHDVIFSCLPYFMNLDITELAIEKGKHMVDLGGNVSVEEEQHALHEKAKRAGSKIFPAAGIAPGAITIIAQDGIDHMGGPENVDYVHTYCGGLPVYPQGILNYMEVFSKKGWFNEIRETGYILKDWFVEAVDPMTCLETLEFYEPFGRLEAVHTSGGMSTLVDNNAGLIREMYYKTLRYPGHWAVMALLNRLGYLDEKKLIGSVSPADISEEVLGRHVEYDSEDVILARWVIGSTPENGKHRELEYNLIVLGNSERSAMQIATADSASIVGQMAANNVIEECGVLPQEAVPAKNFIRQWCRRGIHLIRDERTIRED